MGVNEKLTAISDAIRDKTGGEQPLTLDDMASEITSVYEAGMNALPDADVMEFPNEITGKVSTDSQYYNEMGNYIQFRLGEGVYKPSEMGGKIELIVRHAREGGFATGEEMGRLAQYDLLWDTLQNSGARTNYSRAFANRNFNDELFKPKYDFVASTMYQCFEENDLLTDIRTKGDGKPLVIDGSSISASTGFARCFYGMENIQYIGLIISSAEASWDRSFQAASKIEEITLGGTIGTAFDIHWSTKLSRGSLLSILNACNKESAGVTITLPTKCIDGKTVTETYIENDTELSTSLFNATTNGYTITYS